MSWCPKCKCEYREGFTSCSDCGCELVEVLEPEKDEEIIEDDTPVFLISVSDDFEARIIESKLNAFGIPSFKKTDGLNGIYGFTGTSGIDIYVPSMLLEDARDLIDIQIK
ncbi:hypothetical protein G9F72_010585 [Clostridium estertheticum]|uniref:hypothetical protein n=1 Tax=Clostridium estertheticum TaxID=238834 RepID=UPI0013E931B5|nr:hypothetical protein [Clostridium estertheticum]MBZ9686771.1 hypothetical protein [Clostridium estertheticum]